MLHNKVNSLSEQKERVQVLGGNYAVAIWNDLLIEERHDISIDSGGRYVEKTETFQQRGNI